MNKSLKRIKDIVEGNFNNIIGISEDHPHYTETMRRLAICSLCPFKNTVEIVGKPLFEKCGSCGCPIKSKAKAMGANCPEGKWEHRVYLGGNITEQIENEIMESVLALPIFPSATDDIQKNKNRCNYHIYVITPECSVDELNYVDAIISAYELKTTMLFIVNIGKDGSTFDNIYKNKLNEIGNKLLCINASAIYEKVEDIYELPIAINAYIHGQQRDNINKKINKK